MTGLLLALVAGFGAGVVAGLFGVGGGILFVPVLTLGLGLSQLEGEATSLLAIIPTVIAGTWTQQRYGNVRWRAAAIMGAAAILGVEVGVRVATSLPEQTLRRLFGVLMIAVAAQIAWRAWGTKSGDPEARGR
ncbi:MAG: sulfite exporter TauE/SafE family protein [Gaiellaceae bacterium]